MFVLYAFLVTIAFSGVSYIFVKLFQLENYRMSNYLKKVCKFDFAFGKKTPLVFTNRIKRLFFCIFLFNFCIFLLLYGAIPNFWVNFVFTFLIFIFSPIWVTLAFLCTFPIENMIKQNFVRKAKKKLSRCACKTIAITGSYGKTSTKNILFQMLREEFDVCATPKSFNTPMGVCKTILENLKETDDFFIVEFGARRVGDIEKLSSLVGVDFGIITPIGNCHLETFGSLERLENTKFELCEGAKDLVVFSGKSKSSKKLFERFEHKKYLVGENGSFAYAKDVKVSQEGCKFTLVLEGKCLKCKTRLLGQASIDNIVEAAAMAHLLGESDFDIVRAIERLTPTPHRLELIKGFVNVIDDSYNSNLDGFKEALAVLSCFGGRKIVVSPGIVELGKTQYETNRLVGKEVAKCADIFLIMNETNKAALTEGATSANEEVQADGANEGDEAGGAPAEEKENAKGCQILYAKTREEQKKILKGLLTSGDTVLFENDLPDNMK